MATAGARWVAKKPRMVERWAPAVQRAIADNSFAKGIEPVTATEFDRAYGAGLIAAVRGNAWLLGLCASPKVPAEVKGAMGCPAGVA
jgi:hypothetical protein